MACVDRTRNPSSLLCEPEGGWEQDSDEGGGGGAVPGAPSPSPRPGMCLGRASSPEAAAAAGARAKEKGSGLSAHRISAALPTAAMSEGVENIIVVMAAPLGESPGESIAPRVGTTTDAKGLDDDQAWNRTVELPEAGVGLMGAERWMEDEARRARGAIN